MYHVYILYSQSAGKYYTGLTSQKVDERLAYHNYKNASFTNQARDWEVVWSQEVGSKSEGLLLERKIKKRGAKRFLGL